MVKLISLRQDAEIAHRKYMDEIRQEEADKMAYLEKTTSECFEKIFGRRPTRVEGSFAWSDDLKFVFREYIVPKSELLSDHFFYLFQPCPDCGKMVAGAGSIDSLKDLGRQLDGEWWTPDGMHEGVCRPAPRNAWESLMHQLSDIMGYGDE